jgi:hypothetical protein
MSSNAESFPPADGYDIGKSLNVKGLSQKEKRVIVTRAFRHYPASFTYQQKIRHLAQRLSMTANAVLLMGKRWDFSTLHIEAQAQAIAAASTVTPIVLQPAEKPFSTTEFVSELKLFTRRAVDASSRFTAVTARLIELYAYRIEAKILNTPDPTTLDFLELDMLYGKLSDYVNKAKGFMQPQAVASLLNAIRFADSIPPPTEGIEEGVTIHRLQQTLIEMGAVSILNNPEAAKAVFSQYRDQIPNIEGTR